MELHALAERILLGASLEDKLAAPAPGVIVSDARRPCAMRVPSAPGRPAALTFRSDRALVPFPPRERLGERASAGAALHAFANHELLALELMALALLRFPDADPRFRRELLATLRDEQRHLSLYLARMAELGVEFGEFATSPFFWDCLAQVQTVEQFVAGMSLTLEQANLDFATDYAAAFASVGDDSTSALLERVHREEIVHVARGVQWFARERPGVPLWDAWIAALPPPLTPRRGRGARLDLDSRRKAGFPEEFVQRVRFFAHSRGRQPNLYVWNPACEEEIAHGSDSVRSGLVRDLEHDLETVAVLLAGEDDAVQVSEAPTARWLETLSRAGVPLPRFVTKDEIEALAPARVVPWGASPRFVGWQDTWSPLFDKRESAGWLRALHEELREASGDRLVAGDALPVVVHNAEAAWEQAKVFRAAGFPHVVWKQGLGASGRGQLRLLHESEPTPKQWGWLRRHAPRGLRVGPWLERRADLSFHFDVGVDGLRPRGIVRFETDSNGRFRAAFVGSATAGMAPVLRRFLAGDGRDARWLDRVVAVLARGLTEPMGAAGYLGPLGVDAMLAIDPRTGALVLHPLLEANPRFTFGRLALRLKTHCRAARGDELRLVGAGQAKEWIGRGAVALNDPLKARRVVALWVRSPGPAPAPRPLRLR